MRKIMLSLTHTHRDWGRKGNLKNESKAIYQEKCVKNKRYKITFRTKRNHLHNLFCENCLWTASASILTTPGTNTKANPAACLVRHPTPLLHPLLSPPHTHTLYFYLVTYKLDWTVFGYKHLHHCTPDRLSSCLTLHTPTPPLQSTTDAPRVPHGPRRVALRSACNTLPLRQGPH